VSSTIYLLTICLPLGTALLIFGMKYLAAIQQAKARLAQEHAWREVAAGASQAQADTARALASIQTSLAALETRLGSVERVLKEVE
jgi:hypothetical protein